RGGVHPSEDFSGLIVQRASGSSHILALKVQQIVGYPVPPALRALWRLAVRKVFSVKFLPLDHTSRERLRRTELDGLLDSVGRPSELACLRVGSGEDVERLRIAASGQLDGALREPNGFVPVAQAIVGTRGEHPGQVGENWSPISSELERFTK